MQSNEKFYRNIFGTSGTEGLLFLLQFITSVVIARNLGADGRGELALVMLWPFFIAGLINGGSRFALIYHVARPQWGVCETLGSALNVGIFSGAIGFLGTLFVLFILLSDLEQSLWFLVLMVACCLPAVLVQQLVEPVLLGLKRIYLWNFFRIAEPACYLIIIASLAYLERLTVAYALYSFLLIKITVLGISVISMLRAKITAKYSKECQISFIKYAAKCLPNGWMGNVNAQADQLVLSVLFEPITLGIYRIAVNSAGMFKIIYMGFQRIVMVDVANMEDGHGQLIRAVKYLRGMMLVSGLCLLPSLFLIGPAIRIVYGDEFIEGVVPARILLCAVFFQGICGILGNTFRGLGRPLTPLKAEAVGAVFTVILLFLLIRPLGMLGASIATLVANFMTASVLCISFRLLWRQSSSSV